MNEEILIVEDDAGISRFLSLELSHDGYKTTACFDGGQALAAALDTDFDLIILDLMLPTLNGIEVLKRLREKKDTPVIILTARDRLVDKVSGLDLGANDYMIKPFAVEELLARIRANLRRPPLAPSVIDFDRLRIDTEARIVTVDAAEVKLTKKEFELLVFLMQNRGKVLTREQIVEGVWGFDFLGGTNLVDVNVRYIRAKIEDAFDLPLIRTVRGSGYIVDTKAEK